ncbi:nucleotidyltransferase family protein [Niveispirillum sp. KHB5.9]|uniref:nucleotidyltransferase domain-containing protein n=1 Tax=Niveispirillum sp. KHB5.9 TaxID=3400269 RepID=UPI003A873D0E
MSLPTPCFSLLARMVAIATGAQARPDIPAPVDWSDFVRLCRQHRVATLVLPVAKQWNGMPGQVLADITALARANSMAALTRMAELAGLHRLFAAAGIRFLVLKGIPLSCLLYGDPARRGSGDIDLLVAPADFAAAAELLRGHGHALLDGMPTLTGDPGRDHPVRDLGLHRNGILIELHQRLTGNNHRLPLSFDELHDQRATVMVAGSPIPIPGPPHLGLYLFVHGASHGWERLSWLADLAMLCRDAGAAEQLYRQAAGQGMAKAAEQTFALLRYLLDCPLPDLPGPAKPSWLALRLAQGHAGRRRDKAWLVHVLGMRWQIWRLRRDPGSFQRELAYDFRNPAGNAAIRLPPGLAWLMPVLRPFGFVWRNLLHRDGDR